MTVYRAHLAAVQPNDTTVQEISIRFTAGDEHQAHEVAGQFTDTINRGPFSGFALTRVERVGGLAAAGSPGR